MNDPTTRHAGACLFAAASLFWLSWALMPGVGITDATRILDLVGTHRSQVFASVIVQLVSAALHAPAMLGLAADPRAVGSRGMKTASALLLVGAMGSAADAVFHLLAYHMTAEGMDRESLLPLMRAMQGPGLLVIAPMIVAWFAGSFALGRAVHRVGIAQTRISFRVAACLIVVAAAAVIASGPLVAVRLVGLGVLAMPCWVQVRVGLGLWRDS